MKKYLSWKLLAILVATLFLGFFDLPASVQSKILPFTPEAILKTKVNLGLDLQGGSQLDYKIDLRKVPEADRQSIIEGVQEVIERRVNRLGVAEPNIYRSAIGEESHIIVELAEIGTIDQSDVDLYLGGDKILADLSNDEKKLVSLEKAKATVGKTIQLEFKEEKGEIDPQEVDKIKELAQAGLSKIKDGQDYSVVGQEESQAYPGKVRYEKSEYTFESDLIGNIKSSITGLKVGEFTQDLVETGGSFVLDASGQAVEEKGLSIIKLLDVKEEIKNEKAVEVSHILISWAGLESVDASITRTEEQAYDLAKEVEEKLEAGADFAALAKEYSNDASNKETGGKLDKPVTGDGTYVYDFEQAALEFEEEGELSDIVKTQFGYHIIKANKIQTDLKEKQYQYEEITYSLKPDPWKETGLSGKHFIHADVQLDQYFQPYVSIQFNDEGAKLFEEITGRNVGKQVAIFVGGEEISSPRVNEKIIGGSAQITGIFTQEEASSLARDLNTGAIPAPIVLTGEYTIGATLGQEALSKSLWAGFIGLMLVMVFMLAYYRLPGLVANFALLMYGFILLFLIKAQLPLGLALLLALGIFGFIVAKIVNGKDSGFEKFLSFLLACAGFFFLTFLLKAGVVLTLAGATGIIMSIGAAVDANILIFERIKEELKEGKTLGSAVDQGFHRAWSAIRDSNFSSLITCAILFYFGSSIIRGFAFNLAAGLLVSMFTAITVTKTILYAFVGKKFAENPKAFGITPGKKPFSFEFIKRTKLWLTISGITVGLSFLAIAIFGLNLGIDFKGGALMEFKFSQPVTRETLASTLEEIAADTVTKDSSENTNASAETALSANTEEGSVLDLRGMQITESGENSFIVKIKYISASVHDKLIEQMGEKLPEFTEPRFTTIGPTIGATLLHKAIIAMFVALIMIIIYIAFAFRAIPKQIGKWRFGAVAIVALIHDVAIVTGVFAVLGQFLNIEIDALFISAALTVFGYSVNDTIVILDRLRDNLLRDPEGSFEKTADKSLNQTLVRSFNTSFSIILTLLAILFFGSQEIFYFVLALTIGMSVGSYSSIFLATPLLVLWNKKRQLKD